MNNTNNILFVAGHSGGHIIPSATQAKKEKDKNNSRIIFITTNSQLDKKIINNFDFIDQKIYLNISNIPKNPIKLIKFLINLKISFFKSYFIIKKLKPQKIVSMGGLISIPVCLAGKLLKVPIELWELNVEPGKALKFLSKFTDSINICFEETKKYFPQKKTFAASYPIRFNETSNDLNELILQRLNFSTNKKNVLIIGGSQGSNFINNLFKQVITKNLDLAKQIQVIHQTGLTEFNWQEFYNAQNVPAITFSFYDKMEEYYSIADLIICRSGAGTLAEILFFQKKCITIPLETKSTSHQLLNASVFAKKYPEIFNIFKQDGNFVIFEKQIKNLINL